MAEDSIHAKCYKVDNTPEDRRAICSMSKGHSLLNGHYDWELEHRWDERPKFRRIRPGLYEFDFVGETVTVERIEESITPGDKGEWTFRIGDSLAAEPWSTRTEAAACAMRTIRKGL